MSIRITFEGLPPVVWKNTMDANFSKMAKAVANTARLAAEQIETDGRNDIAAAGNFGAKWRDGFHARVEPKSGALINAVITVSHDIPFANVFETGKTIRGKPLLWIPLSYTGLTVKASQFGGGLFRVDRLAGAPLLLSIADRQPKYVGLESVTIKKRFHFKEIVDRVMKMFGDMYSSQMKV